MSEYCRASQHGLCMSEYCRAGQHGLCMSEYYTAGQHGLCMSEYHRARSDGKTHRLGAQGQANRLDAEVMDSNVQNSHSSSPTLVRQCQSSNLLEQTKVKPSTGRCHEGELCGRQPLWMLSLITHHPVPEFFFPSALVLSLL